MSEVKFQIGDRVRWVSSNTVKHGRITHVVPAGSTPFKIGVKAGGDGAPRDHETYVVKGQKIGADGKIYGSAASYWPHVSLLHPL